MGRWAQRRLAGGGPPATPPLNHMIAGGQAGTNEINVQYAADVDAMDLTPADFATDGSSFIATAAVNLSSDTITFSFGEDISTEVGLLYTGATPGLLTPDAVVF